MNDDVVLGRLVAVCRRHSRRVAIASPDGRLTFGGLLGLVDEFADRLRHEGVRPGDRVLVAAPNGVGYVAAFFAVLAAGAVACPADLRWGRGEFGSVLGTIEPAAIVMPEHHDNPRLFPRTGVVEQADGLARRPVFLSPPAINGGGLRTRAIARQLGRTATGMMASDTAAIFHTSGTGGSPIPVIHSHTTVLACVESLRKTRRAYFELNAATLARISQVVRQYGGRLVRPALGRNVWLAPLSFASIAGHTLMLQSLLNGQTLVTMDHFDPRRTLQLIERERVTYLALNPTMAELCLRVSDFDSFDLSSLFVVGLGGSATSPALARKVKDRFGCALAIGYGSTELGGGVLASNLFDAEESQIGTVGRAFPGVEVRVVGDDNLPVSPGETGELVCRSPGLMVGYQNARRSPIDADGWYHTGDLVTMDEQGYVRIVGRISEVIIRAGQNIYPREVELLLESHPAVREAAVVGVPEGLAGERIWAFLIPEAGGDLVPADIVKFCRGQLAAHKLPEAIRVVADLPRAGDGKVQKKMLRRTALLEQQAVRSATDVPHVEEHERV
jgi:acyl-CoA synthetase (AMP-forming)/AMP-acid ligase II